MTQDLLADSAERFLADTCTPKQIREIEAGAPVREWWQELHASGFMDALVPEARGGAGLTLTDVFPLLLMCGKYAVPAPLAQTLIVRAVLAHAGRDIPEGPITIAQAASSAGEIVCARTPYGRVADWVLVGIDTRLALMPVGAARLSATGVHASLEADIAWPSVPAAAPRLELSPDARTLGAALYAAQLAGAMARVLDITVRYANERTQFGRSIGKFQAIQHQLSVMAEQAHAARMAAEVSCHSASHLPTASLAAVGKARTSEAAVIVAAIGHAVHGAMGFTDEYTLQLYTRRLHEWRLAYGSESYWNERIGRELIASGQSGLDFIRGKLAAST